MLNISYHIVFFLYYLFVPRYVYVLKILNVIELVMDRKYFCHFSVYHKMFFKTIKKIEIEKKNFALQVEILVKNVYRKKIIIFYCEKF